MSVAVFYYDLFGVLSLNSCLPLVCHMQPALLYIVPGVIGFLAAHCLWNGEANSVGSRSLFFCNVTFYVANFRVLVLLTPNSYK